MTTNDPTMASVLYADGRRGLRFERRFAHPPDKVWRALTESEHLRHWMPCDLVGDRRTGAKLEIPFWPGPIEKYSIEQTVLHGEILVWDPPSVFEWTWDTDVLRWELTPTGDGTKLIFTTWLGETDPAIASGAAAGYQVCLDQLRDLLDAGSVTPSDDAYVTRLVADYAAVIADTDDVIAAPHP